MACGLALLASGQAFAATYSPVGASTAIVDTDLDDGTKWANNPMSCGAGPAVGGTIVMASGDTLLICGTQSLNLSATAIDAGTLTFEPAWGGTGVLRFSAGSKTIVNMDTAAHIEITSLSLGAMPTGDTIDIQTGPVKFVAVTPPSKGLNCTPGGTGADYIDGDIIAAGTTCSVTTAVVPPSVSAPIFSTKEKPAVFSEEVK